MAIMDTFWKLNSYSRQLAFRILVSYCLFICSSVYIKHLSYLFAYIISHPSSCILTCWSFSWLSGLYYMPVLSCPVSCPNIWCCSCSLHISSSYLWTCEHRDYYYYYFIFIIASFMSITGIILVFWYRVSSW